MWRALVVLAACGHDHIDPAHNIAFVTSTVHDPTSFGSDFAGADAICAAAAADGGLLGPYVAYLGTATTRAPGRLANARGWIRVDGEPFVDRVVDLTAGRMFHPLRIDEHGEDVGDAAGPVATGSMPDGSADASCTGWTSATLYASGDATGMAGLWSTTTDSTSCATAARLYCFGTGYDTPLVVSPSAGRRAFVTVQAFTAGGGLAAADALCANEATLAGVPGTFRALLGTTTASAASRFDLSGPTWVRIDGIALAASPLELVAGNLLAAPNVTAVGSDVVVDVATGGAPGQLSTASCGEWLDPAGNSVGGTASTASAAAFRGGKTPPCLGASIYCLEL